jgi:hypothetical protein
VPLVVELVDQVAVADLPQLLRVVEALVRLVQLRLQLPTLQL